MTLITIWTALFSVISCLPCLAKGDVRLVDGPNPYEGRVEYYNNGVWFSLCRTSVGGYVSMVICRQLGYPAAGAMMFHGPSYGIAPGEIYQEMRIYCSGDEASLSGCTFTNQDVNCDPVYTVGVSCDTNITVSKKVRLLGGDNPYEGRLEIFYNGIWGTVCRSEGSPYIYHIVNPHVACRELFGQGYGGSYFPVYETPPRFGILQSGAIHRYFVMCYGDENNLVDCPYSGAGEWCNHEQDANLKCYPVPQGCGGHITSNSGTFQSPVYPAGTTFDQYIQCVWIITVAEQHRVHLSVIIIETDELARDSNYLSISDTRGYDSMAFTRGDNISSLVSRENVIYVTLTTAKNSTGIKFMASWKGTVCEQNFTSTARHIQSPGYADAYPPNRNCRYYIQQRAEYKVKIQFDLFKLDKKDDGTCSEILTVYDGDSESAPVLGGPYCDYTIPPVLTSTQNVVMIKFHFYGNASSTSRKFEIYYTGQEPEPIVTHLTSDFGTIQSPGYPNLYNNETDYIWNITASKPYKVIILTFSDFTIINNCHNSAFWVYDFAAGKELERLCSSNLPTPVTTSGPMMYVRFFSTPLTSGQSVGKFNASWTTECRQSFTDSSGSITSPEHPGPYPPNLDCIITISQDPGYFIQLNFSSFQLDAAVSGICKDYIEVRDGSSENSNLIGEKYCGTSLSPSLSSTQNSMLIRFHSDGVTDVNSVGFKAIYQSIEKKCEARAMTAPEGNITSPGFPSFFPMKTYCIWAVTVNPDYVIELTFNAFSVGQLNGKCFYAYITLYDSNTVSADTVIDTFCGSGVLPKIATRRNLLTIVLNSFYPWAKTATGFHASYKAIKNTDAVVSTSDVDECTTGVANCSHTCNNTQEPFVCSCPVGMRLGNDGTTCEDCPQGTYGMNCAHICNCSSGADRCDVITGCVCKTGWAGEACGADVNECITSVSQEACQRRNAECSNLLGGYKCVCRNGFAMDNDSNCQECSEGTYGMNCNQTCSCLSVNVESCDKVSGTCHCKAGWKGGLCDIDINGSTCDAGYSRNQNGVCIECMPGKFGLNCAETCTCRSNSTASCDQVNGTCSCKAGWEGRNCDLDIDECSSSANNCSANYLTVCENTPGSFTCACNSGYGKNKNGVCIANCTAGHFINSDDNGRCTLCPVGRYQELANQNVCNKCPAGSTTNTTGTRDIQACRAPPEVKNTASVQLLYVLLHICTREDEVKTSSEVHARIVFMQSDWTGLCNDSACGNAHVSSSCEGPTSKVITSVIAFEEIPPTLTSSDTNTTLPTNEAFLQAILQRNIFDLQTTTGAVLSKNDVSVMVTWSCKAGYVPSGDNCVPALGGGISLELIGSIVGGGIGLIAVVLLVVLVIRQCRTPRTQRQVHRPTPEHQYDSLTPSVVERPHTGWNPPPPPHSSHWPDTLAPKPAISQWRSESSLEEEITRDYDYLELEGSTTDNYLTPVGITATLQEMTSNPDQAMTSNPDLPSRTGVTPLYDRSKRGGLGSNDTALQIVTAPPRDPTPTAHEPAADYD